MKYYQYYQLLGAAPPLLHMMMDNKLLSFDFTTIEILNDRSGFLPCCIVPQFLQNPSHHQSSSYDNVLGPKSRSYYSLLPPLFDPSPEAPQPTIIPHHLSLCYHQPQHPAPQEYKMHPPAASIQPCLQLPNIIPSNLPYYYQYLMRG